MNTQLKELKQELIDATGWITIDRKEARNALSTRMWQAIPEAMADLYGKGARSIVLKGSNGCFASGADLEELKEITDYNSAFKFWNSIKETLDFVFGFDIPTVAMIEGPCLGGACLLASACDFRIASEKAIFSIPVAKFGIVLDDHSIARLVSLIGPSRTAELLYTGNTISSDKALNWGLVNESLPEDAVKKSVIELIENINQNGFGSIYESKKSIRRAVLTSQRSGLNPQHESVAVSSYLTSDFKDRVSKLSESL